MGFPHLPAVLIIHMVISSVLISIGMQLLPPVIVSLPFKLLLFVLVDGWHLVVATLLQSFNLRAKRRSPVRKRFDIVAQDAS